MRYWLGAYNIFVDRNKLVSNRDRDSVYGNVSKRATI